MWLSILCLLATIAGTCAAAGLALLLASQHKPKLAVALAVVAAGCVGLYILTLVGTGLLSHPANLALGQEKHICEIDCHLAYAVLGTRQSGNDYTVTLRMRFDQKTIGRERGNGPVFPGPRRILLIDEQQRTYAPLRAVGLDAALHPGEATETTLTFQLPPNAKPALLRFEDADPVKRILIGSETAILHKHADFLLS